MRSATIAQDLDPESIDGLADDEEVVALAGIPFLTLLCNLWEGVRHGRQALEDAGVDLGRVRVALSGRTCNLLLLAEDADLELFDFRPQDTWEHPGQLGTWCGLPTFLVDGDSPLPRLDLLQPGVPLSFGARGGAEVLH